MKRPHRWLWLVGYAAPWLVLLSSLCTTQPVAQGQIVIKLATAEPADSPLARQLARVGEHLAEVAKGRARVKYFFDGALGDETALARQAQAGQVQVVALASGALASRAPALTLLETPWLFDDEHAAQSALEGPAQAPVRAALVDAGYVFGSWGPGSFRSWFTTAGPLRTAADLSGLRLASVRAAPTELSSWQAWGAQFRHVAAPAVESLLRDGHIDGLSETPQMAIATGGIHHVRHHTRSNHSYAPTLIVYSRRWVEGLPAQLREALESLPAEALQRARTAQAEAEAHWAARWTDAGVGTSEIPSESRKILRDRCRHLSRGLIEAAGPHGRALAQALGLSSTR